VLRRWRALLHASSCGVCLQGVVHAQYRMWQMEFQRRVGNASLAEVAGAAALATDKEMVMYGFYAAAEEAWTQLQPETKAAVQAYTDGINAYLESDPHLPFEFIILGYKPNPWRPADSLVRAGPCVACSMVLVAASHMPRSWRRCGPSSWRWNCVAT